MTFKLGLTGSIGMGKSTTAKMFVEEGCSLWDADAAVHRLYAKGGAAVLPLSERFPDVLEDGAISRAKLKVLLRRKPAALSEIEAIVHPLVAKDREGFLNSTKADICVLDIPLLFETGADAYMDATVCVSVDATVQRKRVLDRGQMTEQDFEAILSKQMPDKEKRAKADFVIFTDTLEQARSQVQNVLKTIRERVGHA
jgi:dephospho-CoA kinase